MLLTSKSVSNIVSFTKTTNVLSRAIGLWCSFLA